MNRKLREIFETEMQAFRDKMEQAFESHGVELAPTVYSVKEGFDILDGKGDDVRTIALENGDTFTIDNSKLTILREGKSFISGVNVDEAFLTNCISESVVAEISEEVDPNEVEEPKTEEAPVEEPKEEAPAEEPKEEAKEDTENDETTEDPKNDAEVTENTDETKTDEDPKTEEEPKDEATEDEEAPVEEPKTEEPAEEPVEEPVEEAPVEESTSTLTFENDKGYVLVKEGKTMSLGNRVRTRAYLIKEGFDVNSDVLDNAFQGNDVAL